MWHQLYSACCPGHTLSSWSQTVMKYLVQVLLLVSFLWCLLWDRLFTFCFVGCCVGLFVAWLFVLLKVQRVIDVSVAESVLFVSFVRYIGVSSGVFESVQQSCSQAFITTHWSQSLLITHSITLCLFLFYVALTISAEYTVWPFCTALAQSLHMRICLGSLLCFQVHFVQLSCSFDWRS